MNNVTFSTGEFTQTTHGYLNTTLNSTQKASFENLNHPRNVAIVPGGITDIWNNANTDHLSAAISYTGDTTKPSLSSATYAVTTGILNLTISERLGPYNDTKIILYDSSKTGNVTFSAGDFAQSTHGYLDVTLNSTQKAAFENLNHPRNVAIQPGGIIDIWNNNNTAHLSAAISYTGDTTKPSLTSATYGSITNILNLTISERLGPYDDTKIILYDASKTGNVTFSASDFTQHTHGYLNTTLDSTQKAAFENLSHPRNVAIQPGGITDIWNNANTAHLSAVISYSDDTTKPSLTSATYAVTSGILNLTISERLGPYDDTKIILYDASKMNNVTFSTGEFTQTTHGYLNTTLNSTQKAAFENLSHPRNVAIQPGGITDIWNNANTDHLSEAISYTGDTTKPSLTSASYTTATGILNITLSERLGVYDDTKIILYDASKTGNVTFSASDFTQHTHGYLNTTLDSTQKAAFENLSHPRNVAITPGGITDIWNNANTDHLSAAISDDDSTPPGLTSALYTTTTGALNITLSERLASYDDTKIILYDSSKTGNVTFSAGDIAQTTHDYLNATLDSTQKAAFENLSHPRNVAIIPSGITDIWNNANTAHLSTAISYTTDSTPPRLSSATYAVTSGILNLTISERLGPYDDTKIILYDSTKSNNVTFSAGDFTQTTHGYLNATLDSTQKASFENLNHQRHVAIIPSGITDIWNNANTAHLTSAISYTGDTTKPSLTSATYAVTSGILNLTISERLGPYDDTKIILYDSSKTGNVTFTASDFTQTTHGYLNATLDSTQKASFENLNHQRHVAIIPGGITDIWNNANTAHLTSAISYTGDTTKPSLTSATYAVTSGILNLTISERLGPYDDTKIILYDSSKTGNVTFTASDFTQTTHGYLNATLDSTQKASFENLNHQRHVAIIPGGITDIWNNANTAHLTSAISYTGDTTPPTLSSATFETISKLLTIVLSERLDTHDDTKIHLHDSTNTGNVTFDTGNFTLSGKILTVTLNSTQKTAFENLNHPRNATILPGGITDLWNNANTVPLTSVMMYDSTPADHILYTIQHHQRHTKHNAVRKPKSIRLHQGASIQLIQNG